MRMTKMAPVASQNGFTLIEMMIVVAIIGILAVISIPAYAEYQVKARMSNVLASIEPIKTHFVTCVSEHAGEKDRCQLGTPGMPTAFKPTKEIASLSVSSVGVITATLADALGDGIAGDVTLTPNFLDKNGKTAANATWKLAAASVTNGTALGVLTRNNPPE